MEAKTFDDGAQRDEKGRITLADGTKKETFAPEEALYYYRDILEPPNPKHIRDFAPELEERTEEEKRLYARFVEANEEHERVAFDQFRLERKLSAAGGEQFHDGRGGTVTAGRDEKLLRQAPTLIAEQRRLVEEARANLQRAQIANNRAEHKRNERLRAIEHARQLLAHEQQAQKKKELEAKQAKLKKGVKNKIRELLKDDTTSGKTAQFSG